ncbi:hypothetical protein [Geothrix sp. SG200]|uniref:hypothetical protein n=1 Tax=Geothrix sp. SG200 TaxID=2922865 RepID=UPI001FAD55DA|nr:hypothetical protein [Geothrix sp. SG200]
MNVERLHAIAAALQADLSTTSTLPLLQQLISSLSNQINQPNQPQFQQQTSQFLEQLTSALRNAKVNKFSPTWIQVMQEIGAANIVGLRLEQEISNIFNRNQITPSVAQQELQELFNQLQAVSSGVDQFLSGVKTLKIGSETLEPGDCELGVLIPRSFVDNRLDHFAEELEELNRIFGVFSELSTGSRPGFEIKTISSTDLTVYLEATAVVGACVATAIERIIALYKSLLEIRKLQSELVKQGLEKENLKGIEKHANGMMANGIDELIKDLLAEYMPNGDQGRANELSIELKLVLNKMADRIDRGFNVEVRMEKPKKPKDSDDEDQNHQALLAASYAKIASASDQLQFLKLEGEPLLKLSAKTGTKPKE